MSSPTLSEMLRRSPWTPRQLATFRRTVLQNPYMRHKPTEPKRHQKQIDFLMQCDVREVMYGGAAGGGKSDALLMAALQFAEVPGYAALLLRKTFTDLAKAGALMERSAQVLAGTDAWWNGTEKKWRFPSGATLEFGYLDKENSRYNYQSSEFQYIGFDELTQFKERDYRYLFSRLRRTADSQIPLRMRSGSNPGGVGHLWVKKRFLRGDTADRRFVGAMLEDNPYLDVEEYVASLGELPSQTREQLLRGNWTDFGGNHYFPDTWPSYIDTGDAYRISDGYGRTRHIRKAECSRMIALDWAMGKPKKGATGEVEFDAETGMAKLDGDCTAFLAADMECGDEGLLFLLGAVNERIPLAQNAPRLAEQCRRWLPAVVAGDDDNLSETMLLELRRYRDIPTIKPMPIKSRNKLTRSQSMIIRAERGKVYLPENRSLPWVEGLCDHVSAFTGVDGEPDDLADCAAILGRMADEFRPGEALEDLDPVLGAAGYSSEVW